MYVEAHNSLGVLLAKKGQYDEAIRHFRRALEQKPGYAEAEKNLRAAESARDEKKNTGPERE